MLPVTRTNSADDETAIDGLLNRRPELYVGLTACNGLFVFVCWACCVMMLLQAASSRLPALRDLCDAIAPILAFLFDVLLWASVVTIAFGLPLGACWFCKSQCARTK